MCVHKIKTTRDYAANDALNKSWGISQNFMDSNVTVQATHIFLFMKKKIKKKICISEIRHFTYLGHVSMDIQRDCNVNLMYAHV